MGRTGKYLLVAFLLFAVSASAQMSKKSFPGAALNNMWAGQNNFEGSFTEPAGQNIVNVRNIDGFLYLDGNRYTTISAVIAAAGSGATINIPCGTYAPFTVNTPNITLLGAGMCSIITGTIAQSFQDGQSSCAYNEVTVFGNCQIVLVLADNFTMKNFQIQGQALDQSTYQFCVETSTNTGLDLEGNYFTGTDSSHGCNVGISIGPGNNNFNVRNNEGHQIIGTTLSMGYWIVMQGAGPGTVAQNRNYFSPTQGRHCIYVGQTSVGVTVDGNYCYSGTFDCIEIYTKDSQSTGANSLITNNFCDQTSTTQYIIDLLNNRSGDKIIGNRIVPSPTNRGGGIGIQDGGRTNVHLPANITVEDNVLIAGAISGICLGANGTSGTVWRNNTCTGWGNSGASVPINVASDSPNHADHNIFIGNTVIGPTSQAYAVGVFGAVPIPTGTIFQTNILGKGVLGVIADGGSSTMWNGNTIDDTPAHITSATSAAWGQNIVNGTTVLGDPTKTNTVAGSGQSGLMVVNFTTTAVSSEVVRIPGMTSSGHCSIAPTNRAAAVGIASVFLDTPEANAMTIHHTATAGWTFTIVCTRN